MSRVGIIVALLLTVLAALVLVPAGGVAVALALLAVPTFTIAWHRKSARLALVGAGALVAAIIAAAVTALAVGAILIATVLSILAWDSCQQAIGLRIQVANGQHRTALFAHLGATLAVSASSAGVAYTAYLLAGTVSPTTAVLLLGGALLVLFALDARPVEQSG